MTPSNELASVTILAQTPWYEEFREGFRQQPTGYEAIAFWCGVGVFVLVCAALVSFVGRRRREKPAPQIDFMQRAAELLDLTDEERADVLALAHQRRRPYAVALLLSPANLAAAVYGDGDETDDDLRRRVSRLSIKLFGSPLPGPRLIAPAAGRRA